MNIAKAIERAGGPVKVAVICRVGRTTPYRWMSGERRPRHAHLLKLMDAINATPEERLALLQGISPVVSPVTLQEGAAVPAMIGAA